MLEAEELQKLCHAFVSQGYVSQGAQELTACSNKVKDLLSRRRMPEEGWPEPMIERFLSVRF